ncbi:MAG: virulence protein RhuM/Fic/DOC family protein [Erysipelothrix sp.]
MNKINDSSLIFFNDGNFTVEVNVSPKEDTVWLSRNQIASLFERDVKTIGKHINKILEEELDREAVVAKIATTASDGKVYQMDFYNLDMIISVGYRVKSKRGIQFRKWATSVLKEYAIKGYVLNENKIHYEKQLQLIKILERTDNQIESKEILNILEQYTLGLQLLDDYDHQRITKPKGVSSTYVLKYDECKTFVDAMKRDHESDVFGIEREGAFKSSIGAIYQTFDSEELYPSLEEKAAHLLYFLVKNHGFIDGNKRIAAALFVYFLNMNNALMKNNTQIIDNKTLVALTILLAESNPNEKELLINLIMNLLRY